MKCDMCGAELDPGERFCGECGQPVQVSAMPSTPVGQVAVGTCPKCSANLDLGKRFCSSCGYDLMAAAARPPAAATYPAVDPAQPATARASASSSRIALIIGIVALVAIVLLGSVGVGLWIWFGARATTANIAGSWKCVFTAPNETDSGNMTLVQNGSAITGTLTDGSTEHILGTFDGQKFSFNIPNTQVKWELVLSPDGANMKGEVQFEDQKGTLSCTR